MRRVLILAAAAGLAVPGGASAQSVMNLLGQMMGLQAMANICEIAMTDEQKATMDELGPRLVEKSGISNEDFDALAAEVPNEIKAENCPAYRQNFPALYARVIPLASAVR